MAVFNKGEIAVDLKTGAQFDVAETGELDETKYGRMEPGTKASPQEVLNAKPQQATPAPAPAPATPNPANPPRFPKVESALNVLGGPAMTAAAGLLSGGASLPVQALIGGGTEAVSELGRGESLNPTAIGTAAALPGIVRAGGQAFKGIARGAGKLIGKQNLVEGGIGKAEQTLGKEAADVASEKALGAAKSVTTPVAQTETGKFASELLSKKGRVAGIDPTTIATAEDLVRNAAAASKAGNPIRYNEIFESAQNMNKLASSAKGHDKEAYIKLREAMLNDLAKVGPEAGDAVKAYRVKSSIGDISEAMRKANPTKAVSDILADPMLKDVFSAAQQNTVQTIARHIGPAGLVKLTGSLAGLGILSYRHPKEGATAVIGPAIIGALVAAPKVGPLLARSLVGPEGNVSKMALPALAQMVRGYLAEQGAQ